MTSLPAAGYFSNAARTNAEAKQAQDDVLAVIRQHVGGDAETTLTLATDTATPTRGLHQIDTEAAAASDNLKNLATTNIPDGSLLLIRSVSAARVVVVKNNAGGAGQIALATSADLTLASPTMWLLLKRTGANWEEVLRSYGNQTAAMLTFLGGAQLALANVYAANQRINAKLGINQDPSANGYGSIWMNQNLIITTADGAGFGFNLYYDPVAVSWKYTGNGSGFAFQFESGVLYFFSAPNNVGGAGAAATITQRFRISSTLVEPLVPLRLPGDPSDVLDAAPKQYVDAAAKVRRLDGGTIANGTTQLDIVLGSYLSACPMLELVLWEVKPVTNNTKLLMRFSTNGGSSFDAGASDYAWANAGANSNADTALPLSSAFVGSGAAEGIAAAIKLINFASASLYSRILGHSFHLNEGSATKALWNEIGGYRRTAQDTDAIRLLFNSGNFAGGKWALLGLAI